MGNSWELLNQLFYSLPPASKLLLLKTVRTPCCMLCGSPYNPWLSLLALPATPRIPLFLPPARFMPPLHLLYNPPHRHWRDFLQLLPICPFRICMWPISSFSHTRLSFFLHASGSASPNPRSVNHTPMAGTVYASISGTEIPCVPPPLQDCSIHSQCQGLWMHPLIPIISITVMSTVSLSSLTPMYDGCCLPLLPISINFPLQQGIQVHLLFLLILSQDPYPLTWQGPCAYPHSPFWPTIIVICLRCK